MLAFYSSHVSNVGDEVINSGMRAWLRDRLKRRHIHHCPKIHDGLLPKHSKLDSSERTMKALLVTWLAEWAASPLTTTHVLSSWNMVFTEVPVTESVDDVDLPCHSAAIPMPAPLLSVVLGPVSDSEEASEAQAEADEASEAEVDNNIDESQAHHLYKEQQIGGLRPGRTDLPKGFVLHHVMYMLSVWPRRTGKGQGRPGRQCRLPMMKAL